MLHLLEKYVWEKDVQCKKSDSDMTKIIITIYFTIHLNCKTEKETNQGEKDIQIGKCLQERKEKKSLILGKENLFKTYGSSKWCVYFIQILYSGIHTNDSFGNYALIIELPRVKKYLLVVAMDLICVSEPLRERLLG